MNHLKSIESLLEELELPGISGDTVESWINVKIDRDMWLRVSRYAKSLESYIRQGKGNDIKYKLDVLSNPHGKYGIQCKLSIILLLQYLKEIKNNFGASAAGTIFESYIGGLLHIPYRSEDFGDVDISDGRYKYQIKLYKDAGGIKVKEGCDYYIFGIKQSHEIKIWILNQEQIDDKKSPAGNITLPTLRKIPGYWTLKFDKVDNDIEIISNDLLNRIKVLYDHISELNYNIETITTGVDKRRKGVFDSGKDQNKVLDKYYKKAKGNIDGIQSELEEIKSDIGGRISVYSPK